MEETLVLKELVVEHQTTPIGIDCRMPRFGWKLISSSFEVFQIAYQIKIYAEEELIIDTGKISSEESIEIIINEFKALPMTRYQFTVTVWDNHKRCASAESFFETGRLGVPFVSSWIEPIQEPTPPTLEERDMDVKAVASNPYETTERDFSEFRPAQYIRIPFTVNKKVKQARVYATAHGIYQIEINGTRPDDREFAPEITSYHKILQYQTYDITSLLQEGENVIGIILADGWWSGRVGTTGDSCQYGDKVGLLLDSIINYHDGSQEVITGENGRSSTGAILYSDLFVGEKYDASKEMTGWNQPDFDDTHWHPVNKVAYSQENLVGQYAPPVRAIDYLKPEKIIQTPAGEMILDVGQVVAGNVEFQLSTSAGNTITLEHTEVLDENGNYYNNILGVNKEQMDVYITKDGFQSYRPKFTYHGFRYVRVSGWPGRMSINDFRIAIFSSDMERIGRFETSDDRINKLYENIWWSQIANTISIPTDCPQREKAGWTGDIMAFAPTLCFDRQANAFLTSWMNNLRADQLVDGAVPVVVPYLKSYEVFIKNLTGFETSCGWGDAVTAVPLAAYRAYGDKQILAENYQSMVYWMAYIEERSRNHHPESYDQWDEKRKERSRYLWNTDFHFGDWLIPSVVLGNPDGGAMMQTAYATMGIVGPAYAAFSAKNLAEISRILGKLDEANYYQEMFEKIKEAFIAEYISDDGVIDGDIQGIYVIALKNGLVTDELRPKVVERLCTLIEDNRGCLDTGFLSVLFLMDVLCENDKREIAYQLLYQTKCPSWLYMVENGATTIWESWGAIGEDGAVSTYSYNHYAFGCIGDWLYRELGGIQIKEAGYKKIKIAPAFDCGLTYVRTEENTPYGKVTVAWELIQELAVMHVTVPVNTTAEIHLADGEIITKGSGHYRFAVPYKTNS